MSDLFSLVVCLVVDDATLRRRIGQRTDNLFAKRPEDLAEILRWNQSVEAAYRSSVATIIDATQSVEQVADEILKACAASRLPGS